MSILDDWQKRKRSQDYSKADRPKAFGPRGPASAMTNGRAGGLSRRPVSLESAGGMPRSRQYRCHRRLKLVGAHVDLEAIDARIAFVVFG